MPTSTGGSATRFGPLLRAASSRAFLFHWAVLFAFWVVLSGMLDPFHLAAGAFSSALIAAVCYSMQFIKRGNMLPALHLIVVPWHRLVRYFTWLLKEIAVANWQVLRIVFHPRLPIEPALIRFRTHLGSELARTILANSITLTPGTITVDVSGDEFVVHALVGGDPAVEGIRSMQREIARALRELDPNVEERA
jgi:multicomponent Na+:H+ antiporter subunit E